MLKPFLLDRLRSANTTSEIAQLNTKIERLTNMYDVLQSDIVDMQRRRVWDTETATTQAQDSGFDKFANDVIDNTLESQSEAKRRLFGRYLAKRLQASDDADEALGGGLIGGTAVFGSDPGDAVDNWLLLHGVSAQDDLPADVGTAAWRARFVAAYLTIHRLRQLAAGHLFDDELENVGNHSTDRLDLMRLTPIGGKNGRPKHGPNSSLRTRTKMRSTTVAFLLAPKRTP